jgi:tetratricopeptide (TPR) repeat protein
MRSQTISAGARRLLAGRWLVAAALGGAAALAGCNGERITRINDPDRLPAENLENPEFLPVILAGAIRDFTLAYSGSDTFEGQILWSGLLSDEFYNSDTFPTRTEVDRRATQDDNANNQDVFRNLGRARRAAEDAAARFARLDPQGTREGRAEALNLAGFSYVLFAENYCSAVPISDYDATSDQFTFGAPLPTDSLLRRALQRFDSALAIATTRNDAEQQNVARIGRGRALLNLGRFAEAAAAVTAVPTTFRYEVEHSANAPAQNNGQWAFSVNQGRWSVANLQGGTGVGYRDAYDAGDRRVPYFLAPVGDATRRGQNTALLRYQIAKYPQRETNAVVANGVEARLIEAEAALQAGDVATFLARHNALRANTALYACPTNAPGCTNAATPLAALTDPGTQAGRVDAHFRERALWLYGTAHRLGDMRRLLRQYGRSPATVYPTGPYNRPSVNGGVSATGSGGLPYGQDVSLPVPVDELNNPRFREFGSCENTAAGEQSGF